MQQDNSQLKIAVLAGGVGSEREVSLMSGQNVYHALLENGDCVVLSDITPDNLSILEDPSIDVFFPILHGTFGEDGNLQALLEERNLCFTGSGSESSRRSFNKLLTKQALFHAHLPVAKHLIVDADDTEATLLPVLSKLAKKFVVKPINQGSSVGISIVSDIHETAVKALECFKTYGNCMVEEFIDGREITVGIVNGHPLPIIEIRSHTAFYDYHAKYVDDSTEYLFDTIEDAGLSAQIQQMAVICFEELGCRHLARVDFILSVEDPKGPRPRRGDDGTPYILEINTLPGFTDHSLIPMAAHKAGLSTPALCRQIVEAAWKEFNF